MSKYIGTPVVSLVTDTVDVTGDITTTDATPEVIIVNDTHEDTDGGREGKVTFKGQQSGGEETTLAQIQASHDGTSDDEKGDLIFKTNDGSDGASPTEAMRIDSDQRISMTRGDALAEIKMDANRSSADQSIGRYRFYWNGTEVAKIEGMAGSDTTNKDDGQLRFQTRESGSALAEAMRIDTSGNVGIGLTSNISSALHVNSEASLGPDNNNRMIVGSTSGGVGSIGTIEGGTASFNTMTFKGGKVGIGETSPNADLVVKQSGSAFTPSGNTVALFQRNTATGSGCMVSILSGNNSAADLNFADAQDEDIGRIRYNHSDNSMHFQTNASEQMRIDNSGRLGVGSSSPSTYSGRIVSQISGGSSSPTISCVNSTVGGTLRMIDFFQGTSTTRVGSIQSNASSTAYNTSSDYRLKENVTDVTDGITRVKQLAPKRFNFIADADTTVDGFLAHEAATVVPEAVTGTKDAVDSNGDIDPQGIDQSKLVPLLTAALQEAIAKIETLETKVAALEGE